MKLIAACNALLVIALASISVQRTTAAVATNSNSHVAPVGLYAPDRYDGIPEMCLKPMDYGYCRAKVKRYYFDMRRMKCSMFYWGGCAGNINNFKSLDDCNKVCLDGNFDDVGGESVNSVVNSRNYKTNFNTPNTSSSSSSSSNNNNNNNNNKNINNSFKVNSNYSNNYNTKNDNRRLSNGAKPIDNKNHNFDDDDVIAASDGDGNVNDDETDADYSTN